MTPDPADETRHAPPAGPGARDWSDVWQLDAWTHAGVGLTVRLALFPGLGRAWYWTHLVLPDLPGPVVVRDHDVPLPRTGLEVRAEGLWAELWCETPLEHWTYGLEAFAVRLDDPDDALAGERGERVPFGVDLEWEATVPPPPHASAREAARGYLIAGAVHGDVALGPSRFELDARGAYRRSWGVDRPVADAWSWCGGGADEFVLVEDDGAGAVDGFVWLGGAAAEPVRAARAEMHGGGGRIVVDASLELALDVIGAAPVPLGHGLVAQRAVCRATDADGRATTGWWARVEAG